VLDKEVRATAIPVPPLDEQRRIVPLLDDHLSRLDAAQHGIRNALRRSNALRDAVLSTSVAEATETPDVVMASLGELAKVTSGLTPLKGNRAFYDDGNIPWITSGDLHQGLIARPTQFITQEALDKTTLKIVPAGTLLIAMYGEGKTRGTTAELGIDAATNQACAAITLHDDGLRPWVRLVLDANYTKLRRLAAGGVQPNLNLSVVRAIQIPIPRAEIRDKLLAQRVELDEAHSRLRAQLDAAQRRGNSLRRSLLAAAFSGKLTAEMAAA
jgi:type I restriction enzyme S subunit